MKAAYFFYHGGPEVMEYGDRPTPKPKAGEALVRIKAAAMNHVDKWARNGRPSLKLSLPHIPGSDGAGVVEAVGEGVSRVQIGDRVVINANLGCGECDFCLAGQDNLCVRWQLLGETNDGAQADYVAIPERQLLRLPENFSFEQAAAAGLVFLTAWHSLITRGQLRAGESVLIVGAGGGVNTAAIQIAKFAGCFVYVVSADETKLEKAQALGADVLINRAQDEWGKKVLQLTDKHGVDVVVDNVGAATLMTSLRAARRGGRILTVGNTSGPKLELDNRYLFAKHLSLIGSTMGPLADFAKVMALVFAGKLQAPIDSVFPLTEIRAAHDKMDRGDFFGKIVLTP